MGFAQEMENLAEQCKGKHSLTYNFVHAMMQARNGLKVCTPEGQFGTFTSPLPPPSPSPSLAGISNLLQCLMLLAGYAIVLLQDGEEVLWPIWEVILNIS